MTTKLIQTEKYLLLIDEEAEIKENEWCFLKENHYVNGGVGKYNTAKAIGYGIHNTGFFGKIIAYYPLTEEAKELDLPLLPNPFKEVDIEQKMFDAIQKARGNDFKTFYKLAAKNCAEIAEQSKQFSLEDVKKAIEMAREYEFIQFGGGDTESKYTEEEIIQSLSTQQLPKFFIPEVYQNELYIKPEDLLAYKSQLKEFQLPHTSKKGEVLKLKTITNSTNKKELVGTYKY